MKEVAKLGFNKKNAGYKLYKGAENTLKPNKMPRITIQIPGMWRIFNILFLNFHMSMLNEKKYMYINIYIYIHTCDMFTCIYFIIIMANLEKRISAI